MSDTRDFHFTDYQPMTLPIGVISALAIRMAEMLKVIGYRSLDALIDATVPSSHPPARAAGLGAALTEREALDACAKPPTRTSR